MSVMVVAVRSDIRFSLHCNNSGVSLPGQPDTVRRPEHWRAPIRSNKAFAIAVGISLGLGVLLMFASLHHAASNMQATM